MTEVVWRKTASLIATTTRRNNMIIDSRKYVVTFLTCRGNKAERTMTGQSLKAIMRDGIEVISWQDIQ